MDSDSLRQDAVVSVRNASDAARRADAAYRRLRDSCAHESLWEATYNGIVAEDISATYRFCPRCGAHDRMRRGRWPLLRGEAKITSSEQLDALFRRVCRELGLSIPRLGTL